MSESSHGALQPNGEILGYRLKYPIGSGGYGEVWAADAPGGICKAVKVIYGFHDDERAKREMKSLDRIKQLRHPFLISLERIDVVDGRLVIISELADRCLRDRFNECRSQGQAGIPRDQLLAYLGNVADALDYLTNEHGLQHLDVKPENLLMIGNHVKVADFGLVKNVRDYNQSIMDGFTPYYAAPELFDGRASRSSDQYSLAIVYHELLTGTRPFSGTTAAQLASQHTSSLPNLRSLPTRDQAVISRALAKEPDKRYRHCRAMIEDLTRRKTKFQVKRRASASEMEDSVPTLRLPQDGEWTEGKLKQPLAPTDTGYWPDKLEREYLPPINTGEAEAKFRPTLLLGIGRTGGILLAKLKRQIQARTGSDQSLRSIKFSYFDTDRRGIYQVTAGDPRKGCLQGAETFEMPLQPRETYRASNKDFSWLSRRWLFNVPRSLQTEGMRPLGRLALADHFDAVYRRISDALLEIGEPESLADTAEALQLTPCDQSPQVIVVGSVAGGVGSGTALDFAHAVKTALSEQGYDENAIYGLFTHSTPEDANARRLAIVNTYLFLSEYNHYCLNGYVGGAAIDLPEFEPGSIFSGLYFVDLGEQLPNGVYEHRLDDIAQYLFYSTASKCIPLFQACRKETEEPELMLRSLGCANSAGGVGELVRIASEKLSLQLAEYWVDHCQNNQSINWQQAARQIMAYVGVNPVSMEQRWSKVEEKHWPEGILCQLQEPLIELVQGCEQEPPPFSHSVEKYVRQVEELAGFSDSSNQGSLNKLFGAEVDRFAKEIANGISDQLWQLINQPGVRFGGTLCVARQLKQLLQEYLETLRERDDQLAASHRKSQCDLQGIDPSKYQNTNFVARVVKIGEQLALTRCQMVTGRATVALVKATLNKTTELADLVEDLSQQLKLASQSWPNNDFQQEEPTSDGEQGANAIGKLIRDHLRNSFDRLVVEADEAFQPNQANSCSGLRDLSEVRASWLRDLPPSLHAVFQPLIMRTLKSIKLNSLIEEHQLSESEVREWLQGLLRASTPRATSCGGSVRTIMAIPEQADPKEWGEVVKQLTSQPPAFVKLGDGECVLCQEVGDIPIDHLAMQLIEENADCAELINRLHVRNDVDWTSLTQHA